MLTIRIFDANGKPAGLIENVPDDADPSVIMDHLSLVETDDPNQALSIRVENEAGEGYWILLGERKIPEIEHRRSRDRKN